MLFKKKYSDFKSESLSIQTWRKFKNDKLAMFGLMLVGLATLISILGYLITPDSTPYANDQKPELLIKKPGFETKILQVKKNDRFQHVNWFQKMLFGKVNEYTNIPYHSYSFSGFDIIVEEYTGNTPT